MGICNVGCMFHNEHEKRGPIEKNAQNSKTSCKNSSLAYCTRNNNNIINVAFIVCSLESEILNKADVFERSHLTTSFRPLELVLLS